MEEKRNINVGRVCLGAAVVIICGILVNVFLSKIFSFIGWFGFEYGWFKNPRCWGCIIGIIVIVAIIHLFNKYIKLNTCRIYTDTTLPAKVFYVINIVLTIIGVIITIVQLCRIFYWVGFSTGLFLAFIPLFRIEIAAGIFKYAAYIFGDQHKNFDNI